MFIGLLVLALMTTAAVVVNDYTTWGGPEFVDTERE